MQKKVSHWIFRRSPQELFTCNMEKRNTKKRLRPRSKTPLECLISLPFLTRAPCWVIFILKNYSWLQCAIPIDWLVFFVAYISLDDDDEKFCIPLHFFLLLQTKYLFKISPSTFPKLFFSLALTQIEVNFMHHTAIPSRNGKLLIKMLSLVYWWSVIPWNYFKMKTKQKKFP